MGCFDDGDPQETRSTFNSQTLTLQLKAVELLSLEDLLGARQVFEVIGIETAKWTAKNNRRKGGVWWMQLDPATDLLDLFPLSPRAEAWKDVEEQEDSVREGRLGFRRQAE